MGKFFKFIFGAFKGLTGIVLYTFEVLITIASFYLLSKISDLLDAKLWLTIIGMIFVLPLFLIAFFSSIKVSVTGFLKSILRKKVFLIIFQLIMVAANAYLIYSVLQVLASIGINIF
ncbi:MAG: hypothetical protein IJ008_02215 [Clostridia bacterium]|nr:hypothetical protein [Clostridia bacterium]